MAESPALAALRYREEAGDVRQRGLDATDPEARAALFEEAEALIRLAEEAERAAKARVR